MAQVYLNKKLEDALYALPTLWVTYLTQDEALASREDPFEYDEDETQDNLAGWYYCSCMPGCMPDSDFSGPYATEIEAVKAGREDYNEYEDCEDEDLYTDEDY